MESTPQEEAEGRDVVKVLAVVLERLVKNNAPQAASDRRETPFHALRAPAIGIQQYLERIHKYASCSKECFILALVYIDRLIQKSGFLLTDLNVHRVVITAVLLAAKFFDDAYYNNAYYARVGGVLVSEMNALEVEFLFKINFSLRVVPGEFEKYRGELTDLNPAVVYQNPAVAMAPVPMPVAAPVPMPMAVPDPSMNHYPIQALQQSMITPAPAQAPFTQHHLQQQQLETNALEPMVFPFPTLANQVSTLQQPQAQPAQDPTELNLLYHHNQITPAAAPLVDPRYSGHQHQILLHGAAAAQRAHQVYTPTEMESTYYSAPAAIPDGSAASNLSLQIAAAQVQAQVQAPAAPTTVYAQPTASYMAPMSATAAAPEITPSPPPQPPAVDIYGAPTISAYDGAMTGAYLKSANAAAAMLNPPSQYPTTCLEQHLQGYPAATTTSTMDHLQLRARLLPSASRPIAIAGHHGPGRPHQMLPPEHHNGSWSRMVSVERGSHASDPTS
ncbi:hypothetical protein ACHAWF_016756 [Thalassiosira exigua]